MAGNGEPTRLALSAYPSGEPVPGTMADVRRLAAKGKRLLERYADAKGSAASSRARKSSSERKPRSWRRRRGPQVRRRRRSVARVAKPARARRTPSSETSTGGKRRERAAARRTRQSRTRLTPRCGRAGQRRRPGKRRPRSPHVKPARSVLAPDPHRRWKLPASRRIPLNPVTIGTPRSSSR